MLYSLYCMTVPARDLNKDLVRELERKELYFERKRISLRKDLDSKVRLELSNSLEKVMCEDLGDMIAIKNMAGQLDNAAVREQLHQIEEDYMIQVQTAAYLQLVHHLKTRTTGMMMGILMFFHCFF